MKKAMEERALSKVGWTVGNPCSSGYGHHAYPHDQSPFVRVSFLSPQRWELSGAINIHHNLLKPKT